LTQLVETLIKTKPDSCRITKTGNMLQCGDLTNIPNRNQITVDSGEGKIPVGLILTDIRHCDHDDEVTDNERVLTQLGELDITYEDELDLTDPEAVKQYAKNIRAERQFYKTVDNKLVVCDEIKSIPRHFFFFCSQDTRPYTGEEFLEEARAAEDSAIRPNQP